MLVNFLIALFLLLATGLLTNQSAPFPRLMIAGVIATVSTLILFVPELPFILQLFYQACSALLVIKIAYHPFRGRWFYQLVVWYYLLNLLLAGIAAFILLQSKTTYHGLQTNNLSIYLYIPSHLLIGCVIGVYLALKIFIYCFARPIQNTPLQPIVISFGNECIQVTAFFDTGFVMQDIFTNQQILLLSLPSIKGQLSPSLNDFLVAALQFDARIEASDISIRYLPCKTVTGTRLLPAITAQKVYHQKAPEEILKDVLVVFCEENNFCYGSHALFGATLAKRLLQEKEFCL